MEEVESRLALHNFSTKVHDRLINFQVLQLVGQVLVWVGEGDPVLSNLAMGVPGDKGASSNLLGVGGQATQLSARLAKKLNKQVLVSYNLEDDMLTTPAVLQRLMEEIKNHPEKF